MFDGLPQAHVPRWTAKGHGPYDTMQLLVRPDGRAESTKSGEFMARPHIFILLAATALTSSASIAQAQTSSTATVMAQSAESRPNVVIWMLDDVGFAQLSSYGGLVDTPNIDRVAAMGLKLANYHTAPICSASRAAMLTGRNPHSVEMGGHALINFPQPGYTSMIPANAGTLAANLKSSGYATYAVGKWDHFPGTDVSPSGPFTYWPSGQGFDRFYGFLSADTDQWTPTLVRDNSPIATPNQEGYHLSADLADQAIQMISDVAAGENQRPFFLYWATGIAHAPHHAPADWIARYRGKFDMGWDKAREEILKRQIAKGLVPKETKLAPRPEGMPEWKSLPAEERKLYARQMEVFAASLSYTDAQFGRMLAKLEQSGKLDNTIVLITSDNGASAEGNDHGNYNEDLLLNGKHPSAAENSRFFDQWGSAKTFPHYAMGWAVAGNTPYRYYKQVAHSGGTQVPMIMAWPNGIKARGETRGQYAYVTDIAPTVLDLTGSPLAATVNNVPQRPMEGISFRYAINDAAAKDAKKAQYIELFGNKSLWSDGWTIVTSHRTKVGQSGPVKPFDDPWELYNVRKDPGQTTNLADRYPDKVAALSAMYDEQSKLYNVKSMSLGTFPAIQIDRGRIEFGQRKGVWTYSGPASHMSESVAPPIQNLPFRATVIIDASNGSETGPLFALGGKLGGMSLYLKDGAPAFSVRGFDGSNTTVKSAAPLPKGTTAISLVVDRTRAAPLTPQNMGVTILADGKPLVTQSIAVAMPATFGIAKTFEIGNDLGDSVSDDYENGTVFSGKIKTTTFDFNPQK